MTDDQRATLESFIARRREPEDRQTSPDREPTAGRGGRQYRLWLVLAAHLQGLERTGVVDEASAATLAGMLERSSYTLNRDDGETFRHLATEMEERVDAGVPAELAGAITLGLAMEDWAATAVRCGVRDVALEAVEQAERMQAAILAMAELHHVTLMQGFHTGRPAQPVTFAHLLGGTIGPAGEGIRDAIRAFDRLNRSPLGAGTMSGEVVGGERSDSAVLLGFAGPIPNTFDAVADVEDFVAMVEAVASIASPVARLLDEVVTMVRTDPTSLVFGDAWMREDSRLPGRAVAEGVVTLVGELRGTAATGSAIVARLRSLPYAPLGAALDWIDRDVRDHFAEAGRQFALMESMFREAFTVNRAYLANRAGRDYTTSNDLAAFLMSEEQLPPSIARNVASLTLRRMRDERVEMSAITPEMLDTAAMLVIGRELKVEMETLGRWFAPRRFLERRLVEGSPAPSKTREWLEAEVARNTEAGEALSARQQRIHDAETALRAWVEMKDAERGA